MTTISLAKALKLKNRLAGRMSKVQNDIEIYNSVLVEQAEKVDVAKLIALRDELMFALSDLKFEIIRGNSPIQRSLIRNGELKSKIQFLQGLNTKDGAERHGYQNTDVIYKAVLKKSDVDSQVKALEKEVDSIQDEIDGFNAITKIEINDRVLELAS